METFIVLNLHLITGSLWLLQVRNNFKSPVKNYCVYKGRDTHSDFVLATGDRRLAIKVAVSRHPKTGDFGP